MCERERERGVFGRLPVKERERSYREREREVNCYNDKKKIILKKL